MTERQVDPTPEEIEERAAKIREGWSARRWREYDPDRIEIPIIPDPNPDVHRDPTH